MKKQKNTPNRNDKIVSKPFSLKPLTAAVRNSPPYTGKHAAKGAKGSKHNDRNTITDTLFSNVGTATTSLHSHDDTDEDVIDDLYGMGSIDDGISDLADPYPEVVHHVYASHDLMSDAEADLQHIANCLMVDTLELVITNIDSVDETELKRAFGQFNDEGSLKKDSDWRKASLIAPTGKQSLRVRHVKKTKCLHIDGSSAINRQGHNVVSSGDVTMQAYLMCRDVHKKLNLKLPLRVGYELAHGRLVKVTRIDVTLLLKVPEGMTKAQLINALAIAGIRAGINSSLYVNESVYFNQKSQVEGAKIYDKTVELKRARKGGLPDIEGVELLTELNEKTVRVEAVFRLKKLTQVVKKLGKLLEPATFTKEVLAQMVLDLLNKNICHGQVFRRLNTAELLAIPLPYRSTVAHWQNGMVLQDMIVSARVLKEHARYIKQNHKIDIDAPIPDSVNEVLSLVDIFEPKNFLPVPSNIRGNTNLFHEVDMDMCRKNLEDRLATSVEED
jgi:hypothetical protein